MNARRLLFLVLLTPLPARAAEDVPPAQQAQILVRALAYDRAIGKDAGPTVDIAVLARAGSPSAERAADKTAQAFKPLEKNTLDGLPIRVRTIAYATTDDLAAKLESVEAVYVPAGLDDDVAAISAIARTRHVTTLAGSQAFLDKGLALGVFVVADRATIFVNLAASKAEGASFSSDLLRVAQVLR